MREIKIPCNNIYKIALLVSLSCVLQISESLIPHPIPGLRLGLANIITLVALINLGFGYSLEITVLRTLLSSFIMGTFMSPGFILSFSGGIVSTVVMGFLYWLSHFHKDYRLSIVEISIAGALSHNIVQLYLAYFILVKHTGIFVFLPWLCLGAVFIGWFTGVVSIKICLKLKEAHGQKMIIERIQKDYSNLLLNHYLPGKSFIHRLPPEIKIVSIIVLSLAALIVNNYCFFIGLFIFLAVITATSTTSFSPLLLNTKRCSSLIFVSFLFPVFFNSGKHVLSRIAYFNITTEGLNAGILFALRIIFLILASSLLARTTSPEDLSRGLARVLLPLRPLGISEKRIATILSLSWTAIPIFWEMARNNIRALDLKRAKDPRKLITFLSDFIANRYLETEQFGEFWQRLYFEKRR